MAQTVVLPGDLIQSDAIPTSQKRKIHPSIRHSPQTNIYSASIAGTVESDFRKKTVSIPAPQARYIPHAGDFVIAQVRTSSQEVFYAHITMYGQQAILPHLAFEGATKKTRPQLKSGDIIYAKVVSATRGMDIELSCVNPSTGKSDGLGPLTGGYVTDVSTGFADRLLKKDAVEGLMEELGSKVRGGFEVAVGKNGRVWLNCPESGSAGCIAVARCLSMADEGKLREDEQRKLVRKLVAEMSLG